MTVTFTVTSSLEPSGYVTTIVPSFSPGVVVSTGVFQSNFVPDGRSPLLAIPSPGSGVPPTGVVMSLPAGSYLSASVGFSVTVTFTVTSSLEPSGYVTTIVPSFSPGVVVSTGVFHSNFVPDGSSPLLAIPSPGSGVLPTGVVMSLPTGSYLSASVGFSVTVTFTVTSSLEPSGYVTTIVPSFSPGVVVSTGVFQSNFVPDGSSPLLAIPSPGSGVPPTGVVMSLPVGSYLSASVGFSVTVTFTVTSSLEPSGYVTTIVPSFSPGVVVSTGIFQSNFVSGGRSPLLAIPSPGSGVLPTGVVISLPVGSYLSASVGFSVTVTFTVTSSLEPSGYVTTIVPSFSPGVVVSTGVFQSNFVPDGSSPLLAIPSSGSGVPPTGVVISLPVGSYLSASVGFSVTVTFTVTSSLEPSGYVTTIVPSFSPGVVVSTGVFQLNFVPDGRSPLLAIPSPGSGVLPTGVVISLPVGSYLSASVAATLY